MARIAVGIEYDGCAYCRLAERRPALRTVQAVSRDGPRAHRRRTRWRWCAPGAPTPACTPRVRWRTSIPTRRAATRSWVLGANSELPADVSVSLGAAGAGALPRALQRRGAHLSLPASSTAPHARHCTRGARPGSTGRWMPSAWRRRRALLEGEHDFSAFRAAECQAKSPIAAHAAPERAARGRVGADRGHRQRLPAPHGAQHRRPADRHRQRATPSRPGRREVLAARDRTQRRRHRPGRRAVPVGGALSGGVRPARDPGRELPRSIGYDPRPVPAAEHRRANDVLVREDHALAHQDRAPHALGPGGPVDQVPGLRCGAVPRRAGAQPVRVPQVQPSHAHGCARAAGALPRPGHRSRRSAPTSRRRIR